MSHWKTVFALALFALFGFAFFGGFESAFADEAAPSAVGETVDPAGAVDAGGELDHRGRRGRRGGDRGGERGGVCHELTHAVKEACPCNGPDGEGWEGHEAYVECVSQTLDAALGEEPSDEAMDCATKILERAEASEIGTEGYECPERKGPCERPEEPGEPGEPGGGA